MKYAGNTEGAARFMRAEKEAFEEKTKGKSGKYKLAFNIALSVPIREKTASEIKALLTATSKFVTQIPIDAIGLGIEFLVDTDSKFSDELDGKVREVFNASAQLEAAKPKLIGVQKATPKG